MFVEIMSFFILQKNSTHKTEFPKPVFFKIPIISRIVFQIKINLFKPPIPHYLTQPHIAYYVKEYYVFCSHNIAISASREL